MGSVALWEVLALCHVHNSYCSGLGFKPEKSAFPQIKRRNTNKAMAFRYRRTFIDELPPVVCWKPRAQSLPPARTSPVDATGGSSSMKVRR